jgi:hypothetical protein
MCGFSRSWLKRSSDFFYNSVINEISSQIYSFNSYSPKCWPHCLLFLSGEQQLGLQFPGRKGTAVYLVRLGMKGR